MIYIFLKAFVISFITAMPIGPIGLLCINESLAFGLKMGISVGIGCALSDALYGFIASGGFVFVSEFLQNYTIIIELTGALFLFYLGLKEIKNSKKTVTEVNLNSRSHFKVITSTFCLNLTNPMTVVILFSAIFSSFEERVLSSIEIVAVVSGVFFGSLIWWLILSSTVSILKHKLANTWISKIRIFSGLILIYFAISILLTRLYHYF